MGKRQQQQRTADGGTLVVVSRPDGDVVGGNAKARSSFGHPNGEPCWRRMGDLADAEGLPCHEECTMELVREGKEQSCSVSWRGEPYELNCMSVNGRVVSVLAPGISPEAQKLEQLTARERDVLRLLAEGMNSARIAESLSIGSGTVRCHVEHLREKLGAPTRAAIVGKAFRLGYLR